MPRKQKAGRRTNCELCGTEVTVGKKNRHASFCDRQIKTAAFLATLTNSCITIPSSSNAEVFNNSTKQLLTSTVPHLADPTTYTAPSLFKGDGQQHADSPKKRLWSSSRIRDCTSHNELDDDQNEHYFPSGGSANSEDMMDITDYLPVFCHNNNNKRND